MAARCRWSILAEAGRQPENAALARRAPGAGVALHQARDIAADRQPQPGTAILSRHRVVCLPERLEQTPQIFRCNADPGVLDFEAQQQVVLAFLDDTDP